MPFEQEARTGRQHKSGGQKEGRKQRKKVHRSHSAAERSAAVIRKFSHEPATLAMQQRGSSAQPKLLVATPRRRTQFIAVQHCK
eukprot:5097123-Amphidinium_carterae.1